VPKEVLPLGTKYRDFVGAAETQDVAGHAALKSQSAPKPWSPRRCGSKANLVAGWRPIRENAPATPRYLFLFNANWTQANWRGSSCDFYHVAGVKVEARVSSRRSKNIVTALSRVT